MSAMGRAFWINCVLATLFIFSLIWSITNISQLGIFNAFDPIGDALEDVELTDVVFSRLRADPLVDTSIVVVNVGMLSRAEIGRQLEIINQYQPKVVGLDVFFSHPSMDSLGDTVLSQALQSTKNLVMVSKLLQTASLASTHAGEYRYDSLERSLPQFRQFAREAFANLDTDALEQDDYKTCRKFMPKVHIGQKQHLAFAAEVAALYAPEKTEALLERDRKLEIINYRGNLVDLFGRNSKESRNLFFVLDAEDVLRENFVPELIKDKIVLFGFMGRDLFDTSWDDRFFTPLNVNYAGKTNPDMYGVVVHANIVSMILNEDYINEMGTVSQVIAAILLCFVNVVFFSMIYRRLPKWYDGLTKLVQLTELLGFSFLMVMFFHWFGFKMNLTIALAAIALAGDSLEVYYGVIVNAHEKVHKKWFSGKRKKRLKTQEENGDFSILPESEASPKTAAQKP